MKYKVQIESELDKSGVKKTYDIFANKHVSQINHALHIHSYYETLLLLEGEMVVQIGDTETLRMLPGDVVFIPPHIAHDTYIDSEKPCLMRSIVVKFSPLFLYPMETTHSDINCLLMSPVYQNDYYLFRKDESNTGMLSEIMHKILNEQDSKALGYELSLRGHLTTLYVSLIRLCAANNKPIPLPLQGIDEDSAQKLHRILVYIQENYQYNLSMQEIADLCDMDYYRFSRFFKKVTNRNFNEYLLETRLNYAQKKLLQSESSISEIAMECGFEYVSYFIQKFKKKNGITPREYQKKYNAFFQKSGKNVSDAEESTPDKKIPWA